VNDGRFDKSPRRKRRTLYQLDSGDYEKLRPLFAQMGYHLILESMVAGNTRGAVYVDDLELPRAALCQYKDRLYLAGQGSQVFNEGLKRLFHETILPQGRAESRDAFVLHYTPDDWSAAIEQLLAGQKLWLGHRQYFALKREQMRPPPPLPDGITIQPIDENLIAQTHLKYLDELVQEIQSERDSVAGFLEHSFGFAAVAGDEIAGLCTSEFNSGSRCEVGIMTMQAYQRQGIATTLALTLADHAFAHGITEIGWHCWARNTPSVATALKVGFEHVVDYPAYVGWYSPEEQD
jgi:RimJ/RimL family protein N-acetyltransferase